MPILPSERTPPKASHADLSVLIYGPGKIGKSTFCSQADGAVFLATEPGLNALETYQTHITSWSELLQACAELALGDHAFKTVVIDTIDNAYRMCATHICEKHGVEHEADLSYGKGFALVNAEFHRVLTRLAFLPYGLHLISHCQEKEIQTRTGQRTRIVPTLPDKARRLVVGLVDLILYCDIEITTDERGGQSARRVIRTKPSALYDAGDRTGRLPDVVDLDYEAFAQAFRNGAGA